jgi:GTP-binding protein
MAVPMVAIVGRPNVGKSSIFNWLAGRRIAIVDPTAGVTRDRLSTLISYADDKYFELIDTGGMGVQDEDNLTTQVERQIETAIDQAQVILFVVDTRSGLMPLDEEVARRLRYVTKPVICVANKCDTPEMEPQTAEFYKLGRGKLICLSALQNRGKDDLLELIVERLPKGNVVPPATDVVMKIATVGRRNTGKSTFINCLAQTERMIVSEVPGTTRDSVDVRFELDGKAMIAIDTAGVHRKQSVSSGIEFYSMSRAERSIRRADVVLLFLDPRVRVSKVDKQLAAYILDQHKPAVFVVNKWDLMAPLPTGKFAHYLRAVFPNLDYVPIAFITAKSGKNVKAVVNLAQNLRKQSAQRVATGELNRVVRQAMEDQPPPMRQNRRPKIYFGTQVAVDPPTIVLFTNGPSLFDPTYQRYLIKTFRNNLPFGDVPIKLYLRHKSRDGDSVVDEDISDEASESAQATPQPRPRDTDPAPPQFRPQDASLNTKKGKRGRQGSELWKDV